MIRNYIKNFVKEGSVINAYIPEIFGKEKRKATPSKEGKLGVEGIDEEKLSEVLSRYLSEGEGKPESERITKKDLFECGLYGGTESAAARIKICRELSVPTGISANALIDALNALITKEKFYELMGL